MRSFRNGAGRICPATPSTRRATAARLKGLRRSLKRSLTWRSTAPTPTNRRRCCTAWRLTSTTDQVPTPVTPVCRIVVATLTSWNGRTTSRSRTRPTSTTGITSRDRSARRGWTLRCPGRCRSSRTPVWSRRRSRSVMSETITGCVRWSGSARTANRGAATRHRPVTATSRYSRAGRLARRSCRGRCMSTTMTGTGRRSCRRGTAAPRVKSCQPS